MTGSYCIDPAAITDDEILAFALGEAALHIQQHLDQCLHCQTEAQSFAELGRKLLQGAHPASIKLAELTMRMLSPQEELVLQAHVRSCAACQADSAALSGFLAEDASPIPAQGIGAILRRIMARPQAPLTPALGGLRGSNAAESTTYEAEDDLFVIGVEGRRAGRVARGITGMQVPSPESPAKAALYDEAGQLVQTQDLNEVGGFSFDGVRAGRYQVEVTTETRIVVIEPVEVT